MDNAYTYLETYLEEQNKDYEYEAAVSYNILLYTVNYSRGPNKRTLKTWGKILK